MNVTYIPRERKYFTARDTIVGKVYNKDAHIYIRILDSFNANRNDKIFFLMIGFMENNKFMNCEPSFIGFDAWTRSFEEIGEFEGKIVE